MTGAKLVLEVERYLKAVGRSSPRRHRERWRTLPSCRPGRTWRWGPTTSARCRGLSLASASSFERNHVMPSACFVCLAHVSMRWPTCRRASLVVCSERCAPDTLRRRELGTVPVGDVAYALGGQCVAHVSAFSSSLDKSPGIDEAVHHLADPSLRDAEPAGKVLAGNHRVVGHEVERPFLRRADAEGRRRLRHPLGTG